MCPVSLMYIQYKHVCKLQQSAITFEATSLFLSRSPCPAQRALIHQSLYSIRPLQVCCGIWSQNVRRRSFKSCKMQGEATMNRTCLFSTSHSCLIRLRSVGVNTSNSSFVKVTQILTLARFPT